MSSEKFHDGAFGSERVNPDNPDNPDNPETVSDDASKPNGHDTSQSSGEPSDAEWEALFGSQPKPSAEASVADVEMLVSIVRKAHGDLSKRISLVNGQIVPDSSRCGISEGWVCVKRIKSAKNFARLISRMPDNESLLNGIPRGAEVDKPINLTLKDLLTGLEDDGLTIARTKGAFMFVEGVGPMQFDCDGTGLERPDNAAVKAKIAAVGGLAGAIFEVMPGLAKAMRVERASTSAGLFTVDADGKRTDFPDKGGKHLFPIVKDTTDTPRATKALYEHMVVAGYGWGDIGEAGQIIVRSPVDKTTGAAGRLLLEARPEVKLPLQQEKRDAVAIDGEIIDTRVAIPDLSEKERKLFNKIDSKIREALKEEAKVVRAAHTRKIAEKQAAVTGQPIEDIMASLAASYGGRLRPEWPLKFDDAALGWKTVGDALDDPDKYLDKTLSDPLEPEYGGGRNKAVVEWWKVNPDILIIYSQAHGGCLYFLDRGPAAAFDDDVDHDSDEAGIAGDTKTTAAEPLDVDQTLVANRIARLYRHKLRFNEDTGQWHVFDGFIWRPSKTKLGIQISMKWAIRASRLLDKKMRSAVLKGMFSIVMEPLLRAHQDLVIGNDAFDTDGWLLGTPGGTVDLRTGLLRAAEAKEFISKSVLVVPAETEDCPRFLKFIEEVTTPPAPPTLPGDKPVKAKQDLGLAKYIQQWLGYCLTGFTMEEKLAFIYGPGGNGKGSLMETVEKIMGDYCAKVSPTLFMVKRHQPHTQELAVLEGKRLVIASEVPENASWDIERVKDVTGGGTLTANLMHRNNRTFMVQFKLTFLGNKKPQFPGKIDEAIRRRFMLATFPFTAAPPDPTLKRELLTEAPGILRWMINGAVEWQQEGKLFIADSVRDGTDEYLEASDLFKQWKTERIEVLEGAKTKSTDLFRNWLEWRNERGNHTLIDNFNDFTEVMKAAGFVKGKSDGVMVYRGISLKTEGKTNA